MHLCVQDLSEPFYNVNKDKDSPILHTGIYSPALGEGDLHFESWRIGMINVHAQIEAKRKRPPPVMAIVNITDHQTGPHKQQYDDSAWSDSDSESIDSRHYDSIGYRHPYCYIYEAIGSVKSVGSSTESIEMIGSEFCCNANKDSESGKESLYSWEESDDVVVKSWKTYLCCFKHNKVSDEKQKKKSIFSRVRKWLLRSES